MCLLLLGYCCLYVLSVDKIWDYVYRFIYSKENTNILMPLSVSVTQIHTHTHISLELQFDTYISNCNPPPQDSFYTSSFQLLTYFPGLSDSDKSVTLFYISLNVSLGPLLLSLMPCAAMQMPLSSHVAQLWACCHYCVPLYVDSSLLP